LRQAGDEQACKHAELDDDAESVGDAEGLEKGILFNAPRRKGG